MSRAYQVSRTNGVALAIAAAQADLADGDTAAAQASLAVAQKWLNADPEKLAVKIARLRKPRVTVEAIFEQRKRLLMQPIQEQQQAGEMRPN